MSEEGWIAVHRKIMKHWIFQDAEKFKAWITILMTVNHAPLKVNVGNRILNCNRGQSWRTYASWAQLFGTYWNRPKVYRFFKLLESEQMVELRTDRNRTLLIVCNYKAFQDVDPSNLNQNMNNKRTKNEHLVNTNNNENNENNENKNNVGKIQLLSSLKIKNLNSEESHYAQITLGFFHLIRKNLQNEGLSLEKINQAKADPWIRPIRQMIKKNEATTDQLRLVYNFLEKNDFWKRNILSTQKLREKFPTLYLQAKRNTSQNAYETNKLFATDFHDPAETL